MYRVASAGWSSFSAGDSSEPHPERRSPAGSLRDIHACTVRGGDLADQRKADAAAVALGGEEGDEDLLPLVRRDAGPVVGNRDRDPAVRLPVCRKGDLPRRRVAQGFERIAQQIDERLIE